MKFFEGKVADSAESFRVICFNPKFRAALVTSCNEKKTIALINCHVKKGQMSNYDDFTIVMDSSTKIKNSDLKIIILPAIKFTSLVAALQTSPNQEISTQTKVMFIKETRNLLASDMSCQCYMVWRCGLEVPFQRLPGH